MGALEYRHCVWPPQFKPQASLRHRVRDPLPPPNDCPYCNGLVQIVNNEEIYGNPFGEWPWAYRCKPCDAYVGMHPQTDIPLGKLADKATRSARKLAKGVFNPLWQRGMITRNEAYILLANHLNIPVAQCHFGWFDRSTCEKVISILSQDLTRRTV